MALAELVTDDGTFLIQERRSRPREPAAAEQKHIAPQQPNHIMSPQMAALGGIIIIGVLVGSYTTRYDLSIGHSHGRLPVPPVGFLALQLFLARAALRTFEEVRGFPHALDYVVSRLFRYICATIPAVLLAFGMLKLFGLPGMATSIRDLPANLMMVGNMVGAHDVDPTHWRLKIEIMQAALIGLSWFSPLRRYFSALIVAALLLCALQLAGEPARHNVLTLQGLVTEDGYIPLAAFGIAVHHIAKGGDSTLWRLTAGVSLLLAAVSNAPGHGVYIAAALIGLALLATGRFSALGRVRFLVRLGEIAFPVYVVHGVVGFIIIHRLEGFGVHPIMAIFAASGVAIGIGLLLNVWVEWPIQKRAPVLLARAREMVGTMTQRAPAGIAAEA